MLVGLIGNNNELDVEEFEQWIEDISIVDNFVKTYIDLKAHFMYVSSEGELKYLSHECHCEYVIYAMKYDIHGFVTLVECYKMIEK